MFKESVNHNEYVSNTSNTHKHCIDNRCQSWGGGRRARGSGAEGGSVLRRQVMLAITPRETARLKVRRRIRQPKMKERSLIFDGDSSDQSQIKFGMKLNILWFPALIAFLFQ